MSVRKNADGSTSIGILEDMQPVAEPKEPKEEPAKKPKKATKKK